MLVVFRLLHRRNCKSGQRIAMVAESIGNSDEPSSIALLNGHSIKLPYKVLCQYPCNPWIVLRLHQRSFFVLKLVVEEKACDWSKYRAQGLCVCGVHSHIVDISLTAIQGPSWERERV